MKYFGRYPKEKKNGKAHHVTSIPAPFLLRALISSIFPLITFSYISLSMEKLTEVLGLKFQIKLKDIVGFARRKERDKRYDLKH